MGTNKHLMALAGQFATLMSEAITDIIDHIEANDLVSYTVNMSNFIVGSGGDDQYSARRLLLSNFASYFEGASHSIDDPETFKLACVQRYVLDKAHLVFITQQVFLTSPEFYHFSDDRPFIICIRGDNWTFTRAQVK